MKYYKLIRGYGAEDYIQIDETELAKAIYCFLEKKDSVFSGGVIRGAHIMTIQPDYHRVMGWNRGYKLGSDDYEELSKKGIDREHMNLLSEIKKKIYIATENGTKLSDGDLLKITTHV